MRPTPALAAIALALSVSPALSAVGDITVVTPAVSGPDQRIAGIATGPKGNLWFTMPGSQKVVRMNPQTQAVTQFDLSAARCEPQGIALGPDGAMWFGCQDGAIGRITTDGAVTYSAVGTVGQPDTFARVDTVITGPDGNIWYAQFSEGIVGIVSPATGWLKRIAVVTPAPSGGLTVGGDGNVWVAGINDNVLPRITPAGQVSKVSLNYQQVSRLATASNGAVWGAPALYAPIPVVSPSGVLSQVPFGTASLTIARGPLGYMWLGDFSAGNISRVAADGARSTFSAGVTWNPALRAVAAGADGNMWFAGNDNPSGKVTLFRVATGAVPTNLAPPTLSGSATTGSTLTVDPGSWTYAPTSYAYRWERCTTATSGCTVITGASGAKYTVTSADAGRWLRAGVVATNVSGPSVRAWTKAVADGDAVVPGGTPSGGGSAGTATAPAPGTYVGPVALGLDTLLSTRVLGATIVTRYKVAEPGHFSQSARGAGLRLCGSSRNIAAAGTYTATCRLSAAARAVLRTRSIRATVTSTYTRIGLPTADVTVQVTIPRRGSRVAVVG